MNQKVLNNKAKSLLREYPLERTYISPDSFGLIDGASLLNVHLVSYREDCSDVTFYGSSLVEDFEGKYSGYGVEVRHTEFPEGENLSINHGIFESG